MSAIGIRLQYATGEIRTLVVNALREKAQGDRKAGAESGVVQLMDAMDRQADLAEQVADELEGE